MSCYVHTYTTAYPDFTSMWERTGLSMSPLSHGGLVSFFPVVCVYPLYLFVFGEVDPPSFDYRMVSHLY